MARGGGGGGVQICMPASKLLGVLTLFENFFLRTLISLWGMLRSIRSSFRTNIFPYVQTAPNFSAQLSRSYVFFKQFLLFGEEVKIFLIKKPVIIFIIFHLQKFRLKKTLLRYPFYNNNFIFANKRKTKIVILSIIPFYISQTKTCNKKKTRGKREERREIFAKNTKPKINVEWKSLRIIK